MIDQNRILTHSYSPIFNEDPLKGDEALETYASYEDPDDDAEEGIEDETILIPDLPFEEYVEPEFLDDLDN